MIDASTLLYALIVWQALQTLQLALITRQVTRVAKTLHPPPLHK
jgi:hypothetical protein